MIHELLGQSAFWQVNKKVAKKLKSPVKALLLADLISRQYYFSKKGLTDSEGYFYIATETISNELFVADTTIRKYLKFFIDEGYVKSKKVKGVPPRNFYLVVESKVLKILLNDPKKEGRNVPVDLTDQSVELNGSIPQIERNNNKNKEIIINNKNKESEYTHSNNLNSIQKSVGNKSYDARPLRDDEVKNKFTDLSDEGKKLLWNELINIVWTYANKNNWINDNYPKRWEILELKIKDFYGYHLDKDSFESEFFNFERKIIQWIDKDLLKESSLPYSLWNKTKEDLTKKQRPTDKVNDHPDYYDHNHLNSLQGKAYTDYCNKLRSMGYKFNKLKQAWYINGQPANIQKLSS